jgi:beta-glucanase (GH16 family)
VRRGGAATGTGNGVDEERENRRIPSVEGEIRKTPMHLIRSTVCALVLCAGFATAAEWELAWSDEFDSDGAPDPAKWDYEVGFVRNRELQYYTRARKENARVENGMLVIEGRKEKFENPGYQPGAKNWRQKRKSAAYTSASLTTRGNASWKYGRIEVRAKLPCGKGMWPAIWMLGTNIGKIGWPRCGEIDIMEYVGKAPNLVHGTVHFAVDGKLRSNGGKWKTEKPYEGFHVYAIEWNEERIDFFFDETKYHTFPLKKADQGKFNPFRLPQYLILNLAIGGSWGGPVDDEALPQQFLIDYVRIYRAKGSGAQPVATDSATMSPSSEDE